MYSAVEGLPSPRPRLLYALPVLSPTVRGTFFPMVGVNRAVLQRTWGLHELEARRQSTHVDTNAVGQSDSKAERKKLTYGRQFRYDEFIIMPNVAIGVMITIAFAIGFASLTYIAPVSSLVLHIYVRVFIDPFIV